MAYEKPTPADLKARWPSFQTVDDSVVQGALDEADIRVDQSWPEKVYKQAQLLYAAHVLTLDGQGKGQESQFAALKAAGIQSIKIASLGLTVGSGSSKSTVKTLLGTTSYGQRFLELMRLWFPAVVVLDGHS